MLVDLSDDIKKQVSAITKEYEIYMSQTKEINVESEKNTLNFAREEISEGIGIRVIKDNKIGFAFTSDFTKIKETTEQALANTKLNKQDPNLQFATPEKKISVDGIYDKAFDELSLDMPIEFLNKLIEDSEEKGCEVTSASFNAVKDETVLLNSNEVELSELSTGFSSLLSVNVIEGTDISTAYDYIASTKVNDLDGDKLSKNVTNLALNSLGGKAIETNDYDVILDYFAATGLLQSFVSAFSSENVERGRSILKGKEGTQIVDENLSIIDNHIYSGGLATSAFDGEGSISQKTELVQNGILNSFLYDIYNANKADVKTTANASRDYATTPSVSTSNLIFNFKESIGVNEIKKGVLVTSVLGAHTANPITGDFSVEANNAFKIENGEIKEPIKKAMISGNIFELLKDCQKVESEIKQYGHYIIPKILVHGLRVIGQN